MINNMNNINNMMLMNRLSNSENNEYDKDFNIRPIWLIFIIFSIISICFVIIDPLEYNEKPIIKYSNQNTETGTALNNEGFSIIKGGTEIIRIVDSTVTINDLDSINKIVFYKDVNTGFYEVSDDYLILTSNSE